MTTYQEALEYLDSLNKFGIRLGLARIERLLELLGNPQTHYKTIHVTGTNGKGSTTAMLTEILAQAKIKVGMYISPHLESYNERVRVDGNLISSEDFVTCLGEVKVLVDKMIDDGAECPTQFEVLTAMAFLYFSKMQVEYAVIEVGLGGLLDSTNVIIPEVSVITNVTLEHADRCGGTLAGVAEHKAGIIKEGVPIVTAVTGEPLEIIRQKAHDKNADLFVMGEDFCSSFESILNGQQTVSFASDLLGISMNYALSLLGMHQIENSAVAVMTALVLGNTEKRVTKEVICRALTNVTWPGRFEIFHRGEATIIIDGAHNLAGMKSLKENLDFYFPTQDRAFLLGILRDKDITGMINQLIRPEDSVVVTAPASERAALPTAIAAQISASYVEPVDSIVAGLERVSEMANDDKIVCIAGSLYLIGPLRKYLVN